MAENGMNLVSHKRWEFWKLGWLILVTNAKCKYGSS
jgi:hypothetical protein